MGCMETKFIKKKINYDNKDTFVLVFGYSCPSMKVDAHKYLHLKEYINLPKFD
jgi:hypothetical protein